MPIRIAVAGFYQDAQHIFETAQAGSEDAEFALLVKPDGGLHMIMHSPVSLEGAVAYTGARTAYYVSRSAAGVKVSGVSKGMSCRLERALPREAATRFLRDTPLYLTPGFNPAFALQSGAIEPGTSPTVRA